MTNPVLTAEEISFYLVCPRQYDFENNRPISPRSSHPKIIWEARRELLAKAIIAGLTADVDSNDERIAIAGTVIEDRWSAITPSYLTAEQEYFDKTAIEAAIGTYFNGLGSIHVDNLIEADTVLSNSFNNVTYTVDVDAIIQYNGRYQVIQFVPNLDGVHPSWKDEGIIQEYLTRQEFYPRQVGHLVQAGTAIRGLLTKYGLDSNTEFTYISLLDGIEQNYTNNGKPDAYIETRNFSRVYENESGDIRRFLKETAPDILEDDYYISDSDLELIREQSCEYCPYQGACPEYIESEISFTARTQNNDEMRYQPMQSGGEN